MGGEPLEKVRPGQPLDVPASHYNAFVDAARWTRAQQASILSAARQKARSTGLITVRNSSTGPVGWYGVLGIGAPIFTPDDSLIEFRNRLAFEGNTPDEWTHSAAFGAFAVLLEPCAKGSFARGQTSGVVQVQLDRTHATHAYADVTDGNTEYLTSGHHGPARILYHPGGTGPQWSDVEIGTAAGSRSLMGNLDADLTAGGTADVRVLSGSGPGETGELVECHDRNLPSGMKLDEDAAVEIRYFPELRKWYANARRPQSMVKGKLTADLATTDTTFTIDTVVSIEGFNPVDGPTDTITVQNLFDWEGDNNGNAIAVWNAAENQWEPLQVQCQV